MPWRKESARLPAEWVVAGLGNPGPEYRATRHNLGFDCVDCLAHRAGLKPSTFRLHRRALQAGAEIAARSVLLLKPVTYMNLSGGPVLEALQGSGLTSERLIVVLDEMNLPPGRIRVRLGGSAGGHNGLSDIIHRLRTDQFYRVRIGVGRPEPGADAAQYVLSRVPPAERELLDSAVEAAASAVEELLAHGLEAAMTRFNAAGAG